MRPDRRSESGITLVEVLVSVVILSLLTGALASVFVTAMNDSRPNLQRLRESNDAQVIAGFLIRDAQAAGGSNPIFGATDPTLGVSTGGSATCASGSPVVEFAWIDRSAGAATKNVADYSFDAANNQLARTTCVGGGSPHALELGKAIASVTSQCAPACASPGATYLPQTVALTIAETNNPRNAPGPYTYTLKASVRPQGQGQQNTSNSTLVPLLALGGGGCAAGASGLYMSGNGNVRVYGDVEVNAADAGCPAMVASGSISYNPGGTEILNGGTCSGGACPPYDSYGPALGDPFAGLPLPAGVPAACTGSNPSPVGGVYPAGVYPNLLKITGGTVSFATGGTFIFCNGLQITGGNVTGTNILLYFQGGSLSTSGNGKVTFDDSARVGAYPGLLIWQARTDTTTMSIGGTPDQTLLGTIYAPKAEVDLSGNANTTQVTAIVAQTVVVLGNNTVNIGTPAADALLISSPASGTLPASTESIAYSAAIVATGGSGINTWTATGLPAGMSINSATGLISGAPTASGAFTVAVKVVDTLGDQANKSYALTIHPAPSITGPASLPSWDIGRDYPGTVMTAANGTTNYTWTASGLPPGVTIDSSTGAISGNPSAAGTYSPVITLTDVVGATASRAYSNLKINALPAISGPGSLPNWTVGQVYPSASASMTATLGTLPYSWSANSLPPGLAINAGTGVISGTPTAAGTYSVTITVKDFAGVTDSRTYPVTIIPAPSFGTASLAQGEVNIPYSATLSAATGTPPFTWTASGLPATLSLNSATGVISGTPTVVATYSVPVTLRDSTGATVNRTYSLVINPPPSITGPPTLPSWTITRDYVGQTITASGGVGPYTWSQGGLPAGLTIDASTGVITGTPTSTGTFTIIVVATDARGVSAQITYANVVINPLPSVTTALLPTGEQTVAYPGTTLAATNGTSPFTWSGSGLPPGLTINPASGVLAGTPTAFGTYSVTVTATDKAGATAPRTISVTILPPPSVTNPALSSWTVNVPYPATTLSGSGGTAPYTFTSTPLPAGLTLNGISGVISGTPTAVATTSVTVTVHDSVGGTATQTSSVTINAAPAITTNALPSGTAGFSYPGVTVVAAAGTPAYTWSASGLPTGLSIDAASGAISGTPTIPGTYASVVVTATDVSGATASRTLSILVRPAPTVSSTSPNSRGAGAVNQNVTVSGTNFVSGTGLTVSFSGTGITVNSTTFSTATTLTANITISAAAPVGPRDVTVTNPDGSNATGVGTFTVNAGPTVTGITPVSRARGSNGVTETITGTAFVNGATVTFSPGGTNPGGAAPTVVTSTVDGPTQITITVNISNAGGARGTYNVTVQNPDGGSSTLVGAFTVT